MALEVLENKFKLPIDITSAGKVNKELQTAGTFVDKNIAIEVNTPDGALALKDSGTLTGTITVGQSELISDTETAYPITIDAEAKITDVKVGVETAGFVDETDVVTVKGSTKAATQVKKYIKEGSLADTTVTLSAEGVADGVTLGSETSIAPESGFYFKTSATGTGKVGTAGWIPADTKDETKVDKYYPIAGVTFGNTATKDKTYQLMTGPVLKSGDFLYINEGYIKNTKISLADLVPDEANIAEVGENANSHLVYNTVSVYDKDGALIRGTMGDAVLSDIAISGLKANEKLTNSSIEASADKSKFTLTGTASISGNAANAITTNGYATDKLSKSADFSGTSDVSTDLAKISISAGIDKTITVTPVIEKESGSANATGEITKTQPTGHYVAVSADAISGSTEITPTVLSAGYGTTDVYSATGVTVTGGSNASGVYYVPITDATHTLKETNTSTTKAAAAVTSSVTGTTLTSSILSAAPADANYLTISATATPTSGKYTTNIACTTTEGYSTASTNNKNVDATIEVAVTDADNKYIRIYGGELVETVQTA